MTKWIAIAVLAVAAIQQPPDAEKSFRGEIVDVDLEASSIVVKARRGDDWVELSFEVKVTTEILSRSFGEDGQERGEPMPIALSALQTGDGVLVRYELVKGRNVAAFIERTTVQHA